MTFDHREFGAQLWAVRWLDGYDMVMTRLTSTDTPDGPILTCFSYDADQRDRIAEVTDLDPVQGDDGSLTWLRRDGREAGQLVTFHPT